MYGLWDCAAQCPVTLPNEFDMGLGNRKAIYISFPKPFHLNTQWIAGDFPCTATCPFTVMPRAMWPSSPRASLRKPCTGTGETSFPGILAYACAHPCERECKRLEEDRPISICHLKRFLVDQVEEPEFKFTPPKKREKDSHRGRRPIWTHCAYDLRKIGYSVTLFESKNELGGLLTHGFPSYRLPRQVVEKDLSVIDKMGIEVKCNTQVGKDVSPEKLAQSYDAIFIAGGITGVESFTRAFKGLKKTRRGTIQVNPISLQTGVKGIFAGGDMVTGPGTIVESMAHGRKAAISIDRYFEEKISSKKGVRRDTNLTFEKPASLFQENGTRSSARHGETPRRQHHCRGGDGGGKALSQLCRVFGLRRVCQGLSAQSH